MYRHRNPAAHGGPVGGDRPGRWNSELRRAALRRWASRSLRAAPLITAAAWLGYFVARYGPAGGGAGAGVGKVVFITFVVALALAIASGAYERTRAFTWLRSLRLRRRIDWNSFDEIRARWERHRR